MCPQSLQNMTLNQRQEHYDTHFSGEAEGSSSTTPVKSSLRASSLKAGSALKRKRRDEDEDLFWHPSQTTPPPPNFTPGLIPLLKKALTKTHDKGHTQRAYLCCPQAVHVSSQSWGQGMGLYRNFEMACIPLMEEQRQPMYFALLDAPIPPGVMRLQTWLENAWKDAGYDPEGAEHFKHKLVGTKKWIGTGGKRTTCTSLSLLAAYRRDPLVKWIVSYFTQEPPKQATVNEALRAATPVIITDKLPIVLQHLGHSRTVVGYEKCRDGTIALLMFDPSRPIKPSGLRQLALNPLPSSDSASPSTHKYALSPKNLLNHVFSSNKREKREESRAMPNGPVTKRTRSGDEPEIIVIDDDDDGEATSNRTVTGAVPSEGDLVQLLKLLRVHTSSLRKDKYQVLYFPVTDPLDETRRRLRQNVTSMKVS
ncbi:hypothetical protein NM688_g1977 [Phlebia brevispora]|uniref:Uncharacterized protein n=1 Tax=Phlebia brevispora TaxID=194682 RepID=A0ACC1TA00_9APHY|nr:hypothetical protein NM688_g1977 [Phlebia brevispora]